MAVGSVSPENGNLDRITPEEILPDLFYIVCRMCGTCLNDY